jgi:hypothetical protein
VKIWTSLFWWVFAFFVATGWQFGLIAVPTFAQGTKEVDGSSLLEAARKLEGQESLRLLERVAQTMKSARPGTQASLRRRFIETLAEKARSPADVLLVLGPKTEKQVSRQLLYRRYLEQWIYESPAPAVILLDYQKGQDPVLRTIFIP